MILSNWDRLDPGQVEILWSLLEAEKAESEEWDNSAHDYQLPPGHPGSSLPDQAEWFVWAIIAGRGSGKTRAGAEWIKERAQEPHTRGNLVANTLEDVRLTMVEGESGLLSIMPPSMLRNGSVEDSWNRIGCEVFLANGSQFKGFSSERPVKLRGPQCHYAWCDEVASWADAFRGTEDDTTWSNLTLGCRLGKNPQILVTTTPKPVKLLRGEYGKPGLLGQPGTVVTTGSTYQNLDNLAPSFKARVLERYEGTRLGRQELHAEMLEDSPGALWQPEWIERARVPEGYPGGGYTGDLVRIVIGVDPAPGTGPQSDETGIVVAGLGLDGHAYVLDDCTPVNTATSDEWAAMAVAAWQRHNADAIVAESNNGADLVRSVIRHHNALVPIQLVYASRGKQTRAEPIAQLYEQGRVHHAGGFGALEDQMLTWDPLDSRQRSPDRLDALCWAIWSLIPPVGEVSGQMEDMRLKVGTHRR